MKTPKQGMKCPVPWSFARWPELGAGVRDSMSYTHSNHTCGTHIGTYIFGRYEGKGAGIRTQDCAALIPRESVCTEDCGTQRHSGSVPPLRTASSFSLEELSSSLLYLQGPHYLWEPVVPGVSTFFFSNGTERSGAGNRTKHWVLTPLYRFSVLTPCKPELRERTFARDKCVL